MIRCKLVGLIVVVLTLTLGLAALAFSEVNAIPPGPSVLRLLVDPRDSNVLYAVTRLYPEPPEYGVFKSTDQGQSWFAINDGLPPNRYMGAIAMDPQNPDTLYVVASVFVDGGIFKSTNGGDRWTPTGPMPGIRAHDIAVDPMDSNRIFAGGLGPNFASFTKSTDGGATWSAPARYLGDILSLAVDPRDSNIIYVGASGSRTGRMISKTIDGGDHWVLSDRGIPASSVEVLLVDPNDSNVVYAGTAAHGLYKSTDGGALWNEIPLGYQVSVNSLAMDPSDSNTLYVATSAPAYLGRILKSTDGGDIWYEADSGIPSQTYLFFLAIDPQDSTIVYVGTNRGAFKSIDAGDGWFATGL